MPLISMLSRKRWTVRIPRTARCSAAPCASGASMQCSAGSWCITAVPRHTCLGSGWFPTDHRDPMNRSFSGLQKRCVPYQAIAFNGMRPSAGYGTDSSSPLHSRSAGETVHQIERRFGQRYAGPVTLASEELVMEPKTPLLERAGGDD